MLELTGSAKAVTLTAMLPAVRSSDWFDHQLAIKSKKSSMD